MKNKLSIILFIAIVQFMFSCGSEQEAYESAVKSNSKSILENYLKDYSDAPKAHFLEVSRLLNLMNADDVIFDEIQKDSSIAKRVMLENYYMDEIPGGKHVSEVKTKHAEDSVKLIAYNKECDSKKYQMMAKNFLNAVWAYQLYGVPCSFILFDTPDENGIGKTYVNKSVFNSEFQKSYYKLIDKNTVFVGSYDKVNKKVYNSHGTYFYIVDGKKGYLRTISNYDGDEYLKVDDAASFKKMMGIARKNS